jgi:hypothetical protein
MSIKKPFSSRSIEASFVSFPITQQAKKEKNTGYGTLQAGIQRSTGSFTLRLSAVLQSNQYFVIDSTETIEH